MLSFRRGTDRACTRMFSRSSRPTARTKHSRFLRVEPLEQRIVMSLLGQQLFPSNNPWNQNISSAPVASNSAAIMNNIISLYGNGKFHPDFGQDTQSNNPLYGIPFNIVHGNSVPKVTVVIDGYPSESDIQPAPIPANAVLEGDNQNGPVAGLANRGDSHLIVWDEDNNIAYEFYQASRPSENSDGLWHAAQETVWNMNTDTFRTLGWTSADAAGLAILPGLVRPDEVLPASQGGQGAIDHAIRISLQNKVILNQFIYPASHVANPGNTNTAVQVPMGTRLRLKASVDISQLDPESQVIARAMQDYGVIVADNGSNFFATGASYSVDANNNFAMTWNDNDIQDSIHGLKSLTYSDFEVVNLAPVVTGLSASSGSAGSTITVNGANFSGAAGHLQVFFGSTAATNVTVVDDSHVTAVVPAGTGMVDVTVQSGVTEPDTENINNPVFGYGTSTVTTADRFTYGGSNTTPPTVTSQSPTSGATNVAVNTTVSGTFSEAVQSSTISLVLKNSAGNAVSGSVAYNSSTQTETLTPSAALAYSTTYTATLSGAKDQAGNTMSPVSWSFTTAAAPVTTPPTVTSQSPASGATNVAVNTTVSGTFSEAVQSSTLVLKNSAGTAVAGSVAYNSSTQTETLTPSAALAYSTTYTATLSGAKDQAGNMMSPVSWSFTTAAASTTTSIWSNSATPANPSENDASAVELGVKFYSDVSGFITGLKFYKGSSNTGTHVADLWTNSGKLLATATFSNVTASGWQQVNFSSPVAITAGTAYVASYHTNVGYYADDQGYFSSQYNSGTLHVPANGGLYAYGGAGSFPNQTWNASNYWVDVVFSTSSTDVFSTSSTDTTPPTVTAQNPGNNATGVPVTTSCAATFSESVQPSTINFVLKDGAGNVVPSTVTYTDTTHTATLTPSSALATSTTYTATVSGVKDLAGNVMTAPVTETFTTVAAANTTAPTVTSQSPASGATNVAVSTTVSGTFSEAVQSSTISFSLKDGSGTSVPASMSYNSSTLVATLTPNSPLAYSTTYTATLSGAKDMAGNAMANSMVWSFATTAASGTGFNLNVPANHQRIWWTPARLQAAKAWWATHSFVPASNDAYGNAFVYVMTGNTTHGNIAVNLLMNFTVPQAELDAVQSNTYRWGDWVPVVYDWCYNLLTPTQISTFMARYNSYTTIIMNKSWGGVNSQGNNFFWGLWENEVNWAIATYYENPMAQTFLNDALVTRWQNSALPYFAGPDAGGVGPEGTEYAPEMFRTVVIPFQTLSSMGLDLLQQTNWYKEAAYNLIYDLSLSPIGGRYISFPYGDDENSQGQPVPTGLWAGTTDGDTYGDFMTMVANEWPDQPIGQNARQWLNLLGASRSIWVASTDQGGTALSYSTQPLDYYAPGMGFLYTKNTWASSGTSVLLQMGQGTDASHMHLDSGSFQIYSGDQQLTVEHQGYGAVYADGTSPQSSTAHNMILYNGVGLAVPDYEVGPPKVVALQSDPNFSYAAVDLSGVYRDGGNSAGNPQRDNIYAGHTVREFIFIKPLQTLFVVDRLESSSAGVTKTFLLHLPQNPTIVDSNHVTMINDDQELRLTTLNSGYSYSVVNEGQGSSDGGGIYRLQDSTSGNLDDVMLHAIQTGPTNGSAVNVSITSQDANTWTITFTSASSGTATLVLNKGVFSLGGSFGYAASGTPQVNPLASNVETMTVTNNGPVWN